jgi:hypothetical protein
MWLAAQINIWLVFVGVGGYQLFLQLSSRKMNPFSEGFAKSLQYLIGIPTLALLIIFFLNSDFRNFAIVAVTPELMVIGAIVFNLAALMIEHSGDRDQSFQRIATSVTRVRDGTVGCCF